MATPQADAVLDLERRESVLIEADGVVAKAECRSACRAWRPDRNAGAGGGVMVSPGGFGASPLGYPG